MASDTPEGCMLKCYSCRHHKMLSRLTSCARSLAPTFSSNVNSVLKPFATTAPSIYDYLIRFHIIDKAGKRHTLQGLAGCSLAQAIYESGAVWPVDLGALQQRQAWQTLNCALP